jgi:hypothetical protein
MADQEDFVITIDFTFINIEHELWALSDLLQVLEQQMPMLAKQQHDNSFEELRRQGFDDDIAERDNASYMAYHFAEVALPRLLRGPFLISLWSLAESTINDVAKRLEKKLGKALGFKDIRGKDNLDQARKYFESVLQFPLCSDATTFNALDRLRILRNAFAHANGQITLVKSDQVLLKDWALSEKSIAIDGEYLVPSAQYSKDIYTLVDAWIRDLLKRTRNILNN